MYHHKLQIDFRHTSLSSGLFLIQLTKQILSYRDDWKSTFLAEHRLFNECLTLMKVPPFMFVSSALWGNRAGTINYYRKYKRGKLNENYVSSELLCSKGDNLRQILITQFRNLSPGNRMKFCIFLVLSEVKVKALKEEIVLHTQVLIVAKEDTDHECKEPT